MSLREMWGLGLQGVRELRGMGMGEGVGEEG